jgi:hypothetical protein
MRNLAITSPSCFSNDFPMILLEFPILYGDCVQPPPVRHLAFGPRRVHEPLGGACTAVPEIPKRIPWVKKFLSGHYALGSAQFLKQIDKLEN